MLRVVLGKIKYLKDLLSVQQFDQDFNLKCDLNENLGNYWKCISGLDQKRWFTKEIYLRNTQKIRTIDDYNLTLMGLSGRGEKCISNTCNYDILQNEKYADAFFYTQMERRTLRFQFESSDIVTKLLYMGEEKIRDVHNRDAELSEDDKEVEEEEDSDDEIMIQTSGANFTFLHNASKKSEHDQSTKDRLLGKLKGTLADIGEDLDVEIELD